MGVAHRYSVFAFQANGTQLNPKIFLTYGSDTALLSQRDLSRCPAVGNRRSLACGGSPS